MASNTKLTRSQKNELKTFKALMPRNMAFATVGRITVLAEVTTNVVRFATAVASPDELKVRRKVGEYMAAERWQAGQTAIAPRASWTDSAEGCAENVAEMLA